MSCMNKKRLGYAIAAVLLIAVEVCIALFVHDSFVRPFVGDMLVTLVIYLLIRAVIPEGVRLLPLYVFLFAAGVELLQFIDIVSLLGLSENLFLSILIGSTFDPKDIVCYAVGCAAAALWEIVLFLQENKDKNTQ